MYLYRVKRASAIQALSEIVLVAENTIWTLIDYLCEFELQNTRMGYGSLVCTELVVVEESEITFFGFWFGI